jgi:hypothetical protein
MDIVLVPPGVLALELPLNGLIYQVPGHPFVLEELGRATDRSHLLTLTMINNLAILGMPEHFDSDRIKALELPCKIIGHSWESLRLALARVAYYDDFFAQATPNLQKAYEMVRLLENTSPNFLAKGPLIEWALSIPELPPLAKGQLHIPEYVDASLEIESFLENMMHGARFDPLMRGAVREWISSGKAYFRERSKQKIEGGTSRSLCKTCSKPFTRQRGRGNAQGFCSQECERHGQNTKPSKQNRRKTPQGWTKAYKARSCTNCGEKRILNEALICKKCF